jgi:hypothetical protein
MKNVLIFPQPNTHPVPGEIKKQEMKRDLSAKKREKKEAEGKWK